MSDGGLRAEGEAVHAPMHWNRGSGGARPTPNLERVRACGLWGMR